MRTCWHMQALFSTAMNFVGYTMLYNAQIRK